MLGATAYLAMYATYLLSTAALLPALARPSFFQTSGWELVDDEPTLRVETTKHEWGSNDVSITKSEFYEGKDGGLGLHGSASGERDEADVQLDYEQIENTWSATVVSNGDSATGKIEHEKGIASNTLSGSATGAGNTAVVDLGSAIDECDPNVDVNCFVAVTMLIEGQDLEGEMKVTQQYESDDGAVASNIGTATVETPPENTQNAQGEGVGVSIVSFTPTLDATVTVETQTTGNVIVDTFTDSSVTPPSA